MKSQTYPIFPSSLFKWDSEQFTLMTNRSKVPGFLSWVSEEEMVIGFAIRSMKTGSIRKFRIVDVRKNPDNEIIYWYFEPLHKDDNPDLERLKVVVFNDDYSHIVENRNC